MRQLHFDTAFVDGRWADDVAVTIAGDCITEMTVGATAGAERVKGVALPGLANVHSHAFQRAMAGLVERRGPEDDSFWTWREVMYRFLAAMTPDDIEAVASWAYLEMLEAGFTSVGEFHYLHNAPDGRRYGDPAETAGRIVAAAEQTGIGLCLLPAFYAHGGCGGRTPVAGQRRFLSDLDTFGELVDASRRHVARLPGASMGLAPHSLRAVDGPELQALVAQHQVGPIHIHAAEQTKEVEECLAWSGARPVQWLLDNMRVDSRWCLIHCTHMDETETARLAKSGATAGLCPLTEANLGDGIFKAATFTSAGGAFAIGSDSNVRISAAEELRTLEHGQRLRDAKRNRLGPPGGSTGQFLFEQATAGGARALDLGDGALARSGTATMIVLDTEHPALVGRAGDARLDAWIFASGDGVVRDVWVSGRQVVSEGRHVARDRLYPRFAKTMRRLAAAL